MTDISYYAQREALRVQQLQLAEMAKAQTPNTDAEQVAALGAKPSPDWRDEREVVVILSNGNLAKVKTKRAGIFVRDDRTLLVMGGEDTETLLTVAAGDWKYALIAESVVFP